MKEILKTLLQDMDLSERQTHVGLITFAEQPQVHFKFTDPAASSLDAAVAAVDGFDPRSLGGQTFIDRALEAACQKLFSAEGGHRMGVPDALVLFTDGRTNRMSEPYEEILLCLRVG